LGTKLGAVLPLRMRHKAMQLVLGRLAGYKTEKFQFYSRVSEMTLGLFLLFFGYVLGTKLDAVSLLRMRHKAMQLVLGKLDGHKTEKSSL
jgi:membrane protein DedA with SNARE-associated domain